MGRITFGVAGLTALALATAGQAQSRYDDAEREKDEVVASMGGVYRGPVADYVSGVGERVARGAGLRERCRFTVIDADEVNAFAAPPGCDIYVTRGLLAIMNSEAELAAVMGHEVGHVAADHARKQQSAEAISGIAAAAVGAVIKNDTVGRIATRAAKLGTLGYSRQQEYEADTLALGYLPRAGYDIDGLSNVLGDLQREDEFTARTGGKTAAGIPIWARTHPLTTDRIQRVAQAAAKAPAPGEPGERGQDAYLAAIDGLVYGQGEAPRPYVTGRRFVDPGLGIGFDANIAGYSLSSGPASVDIVGPDGVRGQFASGRPPGGRLEAYARQVLREVSSGSQVEISAPQLTRINGFDAVILPARAQISRGPADVVVVAYGIGAEAYHFVMVGPPGSGQDFDQLFYSFRRLSERELGGYGPKRISVVTVRRGDTVESLATRMAEDGARTERFRMLNGLHPGETLEPGRRVKIVTRGGERAGR